MDLSKGKRYFPEQEIIQEMATTFDMKISKINWLMHSLNDRYRPEFPDEAVSIMKRAVLEGFEYNITHAMQHEHGSVVHIDINSLNSENIRGYLRTELLLDIQGDKEYSARRNGSSGGGGKTHLTFIVSPTLSDDMTGFTLSLIPYAEPIESFQEEIIILDKEVLFE
ncbi:hypothetical protein [Paenibacillus pini]|nr:hypothetical protein [Paenibacillus pini]